jgi:hypothetical protein
VAAGLALFFAAGAAALAAEALPILAGPAVPRIEQGYGHVRPATVFNGGDPTGLVSSIHWSSWGGAQAIGTGRSDYVGPHQSVAAGSEEPARIVAFRLGICRGRRAYDAVEWYFPEHGQHFSPGSYIDACTGGYYVGGVPLVANTHPNPTGALAAVSAYWSEIGAGEEAKAYARVDPATQTETEARFAANERAEGITSVRFSGRILSSAGITATIEIRSLVVHSTQDGCQSLTGSYALTQSGDLVPWLIERADITIGHCAS